MVLGGPLVAEQGTEGKRRRREPARAVEAADRKLRAEAAVSQKLPDVRQAVSAAPSCG